jgi:alkanesulfonate monooxygenase
VRRTTVGLPLDVFSTCPTSAGVDPCEYLKQVVDVARWSDQHGCRGILVYSDHSQLDPWAISQIVLQHTRTLSPLVAVQPVYMHPFTVAKTVATLSALYQRRLYLNMVAGGFKNDLLALDDSTPHDRRYERLVEYVQIVNGLLAGSTVTFEGEFYRVSKLTLTPALPPALRPGIFISGSSEAGLAAARTIGATAIKYPKPAQQESAADANGLPCGIRVGIVARPHENDAWDVAHSRFPETRQGQLTRQLAAKVSDSVWHRELTTQASSPNGSPYWLVPFENYQTMCPYLVGSYGQVADELTVYLSAGHRTLILDVPPSADDLRHTFAALASAVQEVA